MSICSPPRGAHRRLGVLRQGRDGTTHQATPGFSIAHPPGHLVDDLAAVRSDRDRVTWAAGKVRVERPVRVADQPVVIGQHLGGAVRPPFHGDRRVEHVPRCP